MKKNKFNKEEQNLFAGGGFMPPFGMSYGMPFIPKMGALEYSAYLDGKLIGKESTQNKQKANANINAGVSSKLFVDGSNLFYPGGYLTVENPDVDTRRDTTGPGYHEGASYGQSDWVQTFPLLEIADAIDKQTNATRPDSPVYNPNLIIGEAPGVGGVTKARNALEALQMVKAMKAAKAAKAAKPIQSSRGLASSYVGKTPEEIELMHAQRSAAGRKSAEVRAAIGRTEKQLHQFDEARAAAEKRNAQQGMVRANREASKLSGKNFIPSLRNAQGNRSSNYDAITVDDIFADGGLMNDNPTLFNTMPKNMKAIGGDIQTNSADFSTGLTHINNGGSHEESPYDGVQIGVDSENVPNLVEEGEVIFNDYVFSKRIQLDEDAKKRFHFPKKAELSYADAAKKLEKEVKERPNDPISRASFKAQMEQLEKEQERQKQEMEAERAKEAFEALSPEEQTALMQQKAQQDAMAEQAAQEQAIAEAQATQGQPSPEEMAAMEQQAAIAQQQISPEEAAMMQQQMAAQQGGMPVEGAAPEGYAYGGELGEGENLFDLGGDIDKWLVTKGVKPEYYEAIKQAIEKKISNRRYKTGGIAPYNTQLFETIFGNIMNGKDNLLSKDKATFWSSGITDRHRDHFKYLTEELGMDKDIAFSLSMPNYEDFSNVDKSDAKKKKFEEAISSEYRKLVGKPLKGKQLGDGLVYSSVEAARKAAEGMISPEQMKANLYKNKGNKKTEGPILEQSVQQANVNTIIPSTEVQGTEQPVAVTDGAGNIIAYDWYRNGSDGIGEPNGFTVDKNGFIDKKNGYTQQYRNVVDALNADNIRQWAADRGWKPGMTDYSPITDPSLKSFLEKGNKLEDLRTDQWRTGATDGKYGFMHHVASDILKKTQFTTGENGAPVVEQAVTATTAIPEEVVVTPSVAATRATTAIEENPAEALKASDKEVKKNGETTTGTTTEEQPKTKVVPNLLKNPDYGLYGSFAPLAMQLAGIGKPDTSGMDAILANAARNYHTATNKYLGNYLTYKPMDTWFEQAKLDAQTGATRRGIMTSGANQSTIIAGLLPLDLNAQIASGELFRKGLEYNNQDELTKATFNRGTDQFNADAFNQLSKFNANVMNQAGQHYAQLGLQSELAKDDANRWWYSNLYGNVNAIRNRLDQRYKNRQDHNTIAKMVADGIFGTLKDQYSGQGFVKSVPAAEGGKVSKRKAKKKRGFTF